MKKRLLAISDLKLAGIIEQMNNEQLDKYVQELNLFVGSFPENEKKIKDALAAKDYDSILKTLTEIGDILVKIHADDIADEYKKQIGGLSTKHEKIEAFAPYFLKSVSMLYIDIQTVFKKIDKSQLLAVQDLKLTGVIEKMDDEQLGDYVQELNSFIDNFPVKETELKNALEAKDYDSFSKCLTSIGDMLTKIHADDIAGECQKQISGLKSVKHEKLEAFATYFLKSISILSIDIQVVKFKNQETTGTATASGAEMINDGKSILAVDDTDFFLRTLKQLMQDTKYKLTCTTSGQIALNFLQKNKPDLFILDIEMPEMNGYELAQKIREAGQKAPIIFLTGSSTKESVEKALRVGAADFIVKPINKNQIIERITKFI